MTKLKISVEKDTGSDWKAAISETLFEQGKNKFSFKFQIKQGNVGVGIVPKLQKYDLEKFDRIKCYYILSSGTAHGLKHSETMPILNKKIDFVLDTEKGNLEIFVEGKLCAYGTVKEHDYYPVALFYQTDSAVVEILQ